MISRAVKPATWPSSSTLAPLRHQHLKHEVLALLPSDLHQPTVDLHVERRRREHVIDRAESPSSERLVFVGLGAVPNGGRGGQDDRAARVWLRVRARPRPTWVPRVGRRHHGVRFIGVRKSTPCFSVCHSRSLKFRASYGWRKRRATWAPCPSSARPVRIAQQPGIRRSPRRDGSRRSPTAAALLCSTPPEGRVPSPPKRPTRPRSARSRDRLESEHSHANRLGARAFPAARGGAPRPASLDARLGHQNLLATFSEDHAELLPDRVSRVILHQPGIHDRPRQRARTTR